MSIGDKIYLPDKRTLDLVKNKVENIFAVVPTTVVVPEPSPLNKNYIADKGTLDDVKSELDALPIFTPDGTATEADVLVGKTFLSNSITKKTGTMPNRGAVNSTITTQGGTYTLPSGYHSGAGKVTANFANLTANNIKKGVNVGGVVGNVETLGTGFSFTLLGTSYASVNVSMSYDRYRSLYRGEASMPPFSPPYANRYEVNYFIPYITSVKFGDFELSSSLYETYIYKLEPNYEHNVYSKTEYIYDFGLSKIGVSSPTLSGTLSIEIHCNYYHLKLKP